MGKTCLLLHLLMPKNAQLIARRINASPSVLTAKR